MIWAGGSTVAERCSPAPSVVCAWRSFTRPHARRSASNSNRSAILSGSSLACSPHPEEAQRIASVAPKKTDQLLGAMRRKSCWVDSRILNDGQGR